MKSLWCLALIALTTVVLTAGRPGVRPKDFPPIPPTGKLGYALLGNAGFLEFDWKLEAVDGTINFIGPLALECNNRCRGQVHFEHPKCDSSCDVACKKVHETTLRPHIGGLLASTYLLGGELVQAGARFGTAFDGTSVAEAVNAAWTNGSQNDDRYGIPFKSDCWNQEPCSLSRKSYEAKQFRLTLNWQFYRFDRRPDGSEARVQGPAGQERASYFIPIGPPGRPKTTIECSCDIVQRDEDGKPIRIPSAAPVSPTTPPAGTRPAPPPAPGKPKEVGFLPGTGSNSRLGYVGQFASTGTTIDRAFLESIGFQVTCPSLTTCQITATNKTNQPVRFTLLPGVVFACIPGSGEGAQDTILVKELKFNLLALGQETKTLELAMPSPANLLVQISRGATNPATATAMPVEGRVLCLDMDKRPPTSEDKFGIALAPSEALMLIAQRTGAQPMQGGWDQARIWVVTGAASLAKIDDRLNPPIGAPLYVRVMQEASEWGGIDFTSLPHRTCLEPRFALAIEAGPKPMQWFAETMGRVDGKALAAFVRANLPAYAAKYSEPAATDHFDRLAALASGMVQSGNLDCAAAAFELLKAGIPESARGKFATHRGLGPLASLLMKTTDAELAKLALDTVEALNLKGLKMACLNLRPTLPAELRQRGAAIAKLP